jgi:hypothetical protein
MVSSLLNNGSAESSVESGAETCIASITNWIGMGGHCQELRGRPPGSASFFLIKNLAGRSASLKPAKQNIMKEPKQGKCIAFPAMNFLSDMDNCPLSSKSWNKHGYSSATPLTMFSPARFM